tara:strand:+ start:1098 stop:1298 length:201 start_codon:yes stop_codon:yes gene_type:complete
VDPFLTPVISAAIIAGVGALWRIDKRASVMDARLTLVLEQITALRSDHKERLDDHERRLRNLEIRG